MTTITTVVAIISVLGLLLAMARAENKEPYYVALWLGVVILIIQLMMI